MSKAKKQKLNQKKEPPRFSRNQLLAISLILSGAIVISAFSLLFLQHSATAFSLKAAVVDQLSSELPADPVFLENVTSTLLNYNFSVAYYNASSTDVDFFSQLAKGDYGIIILRVHSALREDGSTVDLFTSEPFSDSSPTLERYSGLVKATLNYTEPPKEYFGITSEFIERMEGSFPKSVIVAMGCSTLKPSLPQPLWNAFIKKGASAFIGWTDLVAYSHTDNETVKLLTNLLVQNKTLSQAVQSASPDMEFGSEMNCYPETARNLRITDLMAEAKTSQTTASSSCSVSVPSIFPRRLKHLVSS